MKKTDMSMKTKTTIALPVDLIKEILSYLPAKSLLNCSKLVCKSWHSVIKEPDFVKMHLSRGAINGGGGGGGGRGRGTSSSNSNSQSSALMCRSGNGLFKFPLPFNLDDVDHPPKSTTSTITTVTITPTSLFNSMSLFNSKIIGSCNGLVCIGCDESLILVNPCTRRYKKSPNERFDYLGDILNKCMPTSYGFGCLYDSTTTATTTTTTTTTTGGHEYKVVRIAHSYPKKSEVISKSDVKVYSMSTNSWRRVKDIPIDTLEMITKATDNQSGVFLNGALHWMNHETSDLVSFDMRSEEFRIMPRPPYDDNKDIKVLRIMRGCLGMMRILRLKSSLALEISIMKEYGVSESWTHESVIRLSSSEVGLSGMLLFTVWLDGQILIQEMGGSLVLYDMNKKRRAYVDIQFPKPVGGRLEDDMVPCIESLVSLKSSRLTLSKDKKRKLETLDSEIK